MLKREITATFAGNAVAAIFSLGNAIILARVLGPSDRGLLGLALLIPAITATFCTLGQEMVNATFAGLYKDKRSSIFQQSLIVTFFGSLVSIAAICAFYFWLPINRGQFDQLGTELVWLSCLVAPVLIFSALAVALVRGVGRVTTSAVIGVVQSVIFFGLLLVFLVWGRGELKAALVLTALSPLVAVALSIWVLRSYITLRMSDFSASLFKKSIRFGVQISLTSFATFLVYRLNQGILAYKVSAEQVGFYVVAVSIAERLRMLPNSVAGAFLPRLANELSSRQLQVPMIFRYTTIVSTGSILLVGILGVPTIIVLFGQEYSGTIPSFLLLLPGVAALGGASVLCGDLAVREKPKYGMWISYSVLTVNIALNFCLIPFMGIAGAALASTISYILACCMAILFYLHESRVPLKEMMPRWKDTIYVFSILISMIRQTVIFGKGKLESIGSMIIRKQQV